MADDEANAARRAELRARLRGKIGAKREGRTSGVADEARSRREAEGMMLSAAGEHPQLLAIAQKAMKDPHGALRAMTSAAPPVDEEEEEAPPPVV